MEAAGAVYDWNRARDRRRLVRAGVTFQDETLRDGIQNPSVVDPPVSDKLQMVHAIDAIGIQRVNVGLPASSTRNRDDTEAACREIASARLAVRPVAAGRTVVSDVTVIAEIAQRAGIPIEVYTFIGSSAIRQLVEAWDLAFLQHKTRDAVAAGVREGLAVCYVTEDTTRARPETLRALWHAAIDAGATRLCLTDTVGHGTPDGVRNLLRFAQDVCTELGVPETGLDWHGHDDRGLALDNALTALEHGADRIHGTALGIGERCGNTSMEVLLYNLMLLGELELDVERLLHYSRLAARALHWNVPAGHILIGESSAH
jgi:2-isopropylmalate synthase